MPLSIAPLTTHFGACVSGFSIRDGVGDATFAEIEAAFEEYSVLVFPAQPVTDAEQIAFSERFGPLEETLSGAVGAGSKIARITNILPDGSLKDPDSQLALFTRANTYWHTDSSFKPVPAKASLLSAREIPPEGGDTEFASTRALFARLPTARQQQLKGMIAVHDIAESRRKLDPAAVSSAQKQAMPPVPQALVRRNPVNGRHSLLIGSHIAAIRGLDAASAAELNEELVAAATTEGFTYRHKWRLNDMIMWDNRAILHRGLSYDERRHRRLMIRTTVAGAGPTVSGDTIIKHA